MATVVFCNIDFPLFSDWLYLLDNDHLADLVIITSLDPVEVNTAGDLFPICVTSIPVGGFIPLAIDTGMGESEG